MLDELSPLLIIEEPEELIKLGSVTKSLLYNEENARELIYYTLSKQHFLIDLDRHMPFIFIENLVTNYRVKTDFILIHLGKTEIIPNIIPVEVDWSKDELRRHLPKISRCLPLSIDLFPQRIFKNKGIDIEYAVKIVKESHPYYNVFLSPIAIDLNEEYSKVNIKIPIYSIRYYERYDINITFTRNMFVALLYTIYLNRVCDDVVKEIQPILYFLGFKTGIFQELLKYRNKKEKLRRKVHHVDVVLNDSKDKLKNSILNATYKDLRDVVLTIFNLPLP